MITQVVSRTDPFEQGDRTALVCVDEPDLQQLIFEQLDQLEFKIHSGLFADDISFKLRAHEYDVVVVYEHFANSDYESNPIMQEIARMPMEARRRIAVALIGANMVTGDEMQAFCMNCDVVVSINDAQNLMMLLRRTMSRRTQAYERFEEVRRATR